MYRKRWVLEHSGIHPQLDADPPFCELRLYGVLGSSEARGHYSFSQKVSKKTHTILEFIHNSSTCAFLTASRRIPLRREKSKPAVRRGRKAYGSLSLGHGYRERQPGYRTAEGGERAGRGRFRTQITVLDRRLDPS